VIVVVPDLDSLETIVPALVELVALGAMVILDLVVVVRGRDGSPAVVEPDAVPGLSSLLGVEGEFGGLLSDSDIGLASLAISPGTAGLVLVGENRWAEPLAAAARRAGGGIVAGEHIPASCVEAVLADLAAENRERGDHATPEKS
jgi:hypothetical protein